VIVDCGRIDAGSPAMPIVRSADVMVLLTRPRADDLAHLARRLPAIGRWSAHPVLLLVGEGYSTAEVARELGVPPLGRVPEDPRGAAVLCGRSNALRWGRRGPAHSSLGQLAHKVATVLAVRQAPSQVELPRQGPDPHQPVPVLRAVPGVPSSPVSVNGVRFAPTPPSGRPHVDEGTTRGGAAS
jgi:hypothetical protein